MARRFDGTNDNIAFGSDASIDGFVTKTIAIWVKRGAVGSGQCVFTKLIAAGTNGWILFFRLSNVLRLEELFDNAGTPVAGDWDTVSTFASTTAFYHIVITYDNSATTNDPIFYVDNAVASITEISTPAGTVVVDSGNNMQAGENLSNTQDLNGDLFAFCYDNTIWDTAMINRHYWWGCAPGGPSTIKIWHPFWTDQLVNKGTATANGTATNTTVASLPRVERMWGSMMGVGR